MKNKIVKDYNTHKEDWGKMLEDSRQEKLKKLKGLTGYNYYEKIHEMIEAGEW